MRFQMYQKNVGKTAQNYSLILRISNLEDERESEITEHPLAGGLPHDIHFALAW